MPAEIEVNLLLHPVGLWRLANQKPISGKPISVKHEPDVRSHQRLWTTAPGACCADWPFDSRRFVGTSEALTGRYCDGNTRRLSRSDYLRDGESIQQPWLSPRMKSVKSTKSSGTS
jgi:hypothetical protein